MIKKVPIKIFLFFVSLFFLYKCAQIVPLTGGKRDAEPPKLISVTPDNFTKNFTDKKITFQFNEKIQLINPNDNIIITPNTSKKLEWNVKNKTLEIYLPDSLQINTTYKIIFNKTIADLTERNTVNYLEYVFSTGNIIDSFYIKGNVKNAWTLSNEKNVLIALYDEKENDSVVLKQKPLYFTKTNDEGNFIIRNLPQKNFKVFAISDNNNNFNYDPGKEKIDIAQNIVNPAKDSVLNFFVSEEQSQKNFLKKYYSPNPYQIHIVYSFPDKYQIINPSKNIFLINDSLLSDTCKIFVNNTDTAHLIIKNSIQTDTLHIPINKRKNNTYNYTLAYLHNNQYPFFLPITLVSNFWIDTAFVKQHIILYKDKDSLNPFTLNSIRVFPNKIIILHQLLQNTSYTLKIPIKPILRDDSIKYQKIEFKTNSSESYAQLKINILFPEKKNYIVALCNNQHKILYQKSIHLPITASNLQTVEFNNILPDNYLLKIIQDDNEDHQWNTHQFLLNASKRRMAEKIFLYPKSIKLINNWDVILDWKEVK